MKKIVVAIDGYSSCGKSTFAKAIAKYFGYIFIDTGAMYRAVTLFAFQNGFIVNNVLDTEKLERNLKNIDVRFVFDNEKQISYVYLNGVNVESQIRGIEVSGSVSLVSQNPAVREQLVALQQSMGEDKGVIMDGRDIGTTVFPNAELKIFMTASVDVRAKRRHDELTEKGELISLDQITENICDRDFQDENREISPLRKASDAVILDNSFMSVPQQMDWVIGCIEKLITTKIRVEIDDKSGFCFGVVRAIQRAEEELEIGDLFSLGDIVHNKVEVSRLESKGLKVISHTDLETLQNTKVYIRAHGEPPSTFQKCRENNISIIDATCPVVYKLQQLVIAGFQLMQQHGGQVVIIGKQGHPEVIGLNGQIGNHGIVIENVDHLDRIDYNKSIYVISQTTKSLLLFNELTQEITRRFKLDSDKLIIKDTICRNVSNREAHLTQFVANYDLILFVSGKDSSNGMVLYELCKKSNSNCYKIEHEKDLMSQWFKGVESVGICGATSTPKWLMDRVAKYIKANY